MGAVGLVHIDLAALARNWHALARLVHPAECAAVVKADAYGLGIGRVAPALASAGCRTFFVATPQEAGELTRLVTAATVYVLDGLAVTGAGQLSSIAARPVLSTYRDIVEWQQEARRRETRLPAALHVDTGLHRLGLSRSEVARLANDAEGMADIDIALVMSHLACADDPQNMMNAHQLEAFAKCRRALPACPASLAASDGLMLGAAYHFDMVRPGYALYGGQAFRGERTPVETVVTVMARILQVHDLPAGETVGYSATWWAGEPRRLATIAAGYADGVFRHLSATCDQPGGEVVLRSARCPIVGRVSMDLSTIDVTDVPGSSVEPGEWVELIGPSVSIEEVGRRAGTIGYEVLTRLPRRFQRVYAEAG
ncbi:MAG: Alanine racemase [Pseudomonadota bacterium]